MLDKEPTIVRDRFERSAASLLGEIDFELIAESIAHIVWMAGPDGSVEYFNDRTSQYTGSPQEEHCGWDWLAVVHPDDVQRARAGWQHATQARIPFQLDYRIRRRDGIFRWHTFRSLPIRVRDGQVLKWIGTATDIDEQKQLEEHLRLAERESAEALELVETLQATAPVGFGLMDRDLRILRDNAMLAATNPTVGSHVGRTIAEVVPGLWPQIEPHVRRALDSGERVVNVEIAGRAWLGGEVRAWLASYYPVRVEHEVIGVGMVVVDITERKQAEQFRAVVMDNMAEGVCAVDSEGRLTVMNAAAARMLGWTEAELLGRPLHDAVHYQHADGTPFPASECELLGVLEHTDGARLGDTVLTRRDGSLLPVSYSAAPLATVAGASGVIMVFRDTSEEVAEQERMRCELEELTWVGRTRDALDEGRLMLYSQPIVPLGDGAPSEELLLRMVGRDGQVISPAHFLKAAEKYGLIAEIDRWVVAQAARLAADGRAVKANLSAISIASCDLLALIEQELRSAGADPANVVFEITETALMRDIGAGEAFARGLRRIGCAMALDDFGTGYGSFTYLTRLPIDFLKIDVEFVRGLVSSSANQLVVKAIVSLARGFGQQTIAEGVEDAETLALLREYGVDFAQGFHLGRPAPIER